MACGNAEVNLATRLIEETNRKRCRIVVCGDAMVDHWIHGHVEDCQEGCQKFVQSSYHSSDGGAANARTCLSNWKVDADLFGQTNNDRCEKWRYVDPQGRIVFRWDNDRMIKDSERYGRYGWAYGLSLELIGCASAVLLSDYHKGFLSSDFISQVVARCKQRGIPCVADVKREPWVYGGAIVKANGCWGVKFGSPGHANWTCCQQCYVETHGADYPGVWRGGWIPTEIPRLPPVKCVNHVGAGDCFAAHLTLALACGFTLEDAAAVAHSAGRVYVQHQHNRPPQPREVEADMAGVAVTAAT